MPNLAAIIRQAEKDSEGFQVQSPLSGGHVVRHEVYLTESQMQQLLEAVKHRREDILTSDEVARYLKISRAQVLRMARTGIIPAFRIGKVWRFKREAIDKHICASQ